MRCPGSVEAEAAEPDTSNRFAAEGTVAHWVQEMCLRYDFEPWDFLNQTKTVVETDREYEIEIDLAMVEFLEPIIDDIRDYGGELYVETKVDLGRWLPGQFGTLDVGIIDIRRGVVIIRDLKYGAGIAVSPFENLQLKIYALGFWDMIVRHVWPKGKPKPVFRIMIDQPRNDAGGGEWEISFKELMAFGREVEEAGEATYGKDAERIPGDKQCSYCKAAQNGHCIAYDEWNLSKFGAKFDNFEEDGKAPELEDPYRMDPEVRVRIINFAPALKQWLTRLHNDHISDIMGGKPGAGKKVIRGRKGRRYWVDKEAAESFLEREVKFGSIFTEPELVSPAQAEKLIGKGGRAKVNQMCEQSEGKLVLVDEHHPGDAVKAYDERFEAYTEEEDGA